MQKALAFAVALSFCGSAYAQSVPAYQTGSGGGEHTGVTELFFMVEQLRDEVRSLTGTVEQQRHRIEQLTRQGKERYVDLDGRLLDISARLSALESGGGPGMASGIGSGGMTGGPPGAPGGPAGSGPVAGAEPTAPADPATRYRPPGDAEMAAYQAIRDQIRQSQYDAAIDGLYRFISEYPEGDLTVNAYYWLGEVYLVQSELDQARQAFTIVTARFPDHRKASDALYKLGIVQNRQGQPAEARATMNAVISQYPRTNAANLAQDFLDTGAE